MQERNNKVFGIKEQFGYDDLDRLLTEKTNGKLVNEYTYDYRGRTTSNTEVGRYNYNETDYQLKSIDFNDKGNELYNNRGFAAIKYNAFKSPIEINLEGKGRIDYEFSILKNRYASYYGSSDAKDKQPVQKYYSSDKAIEIIVDKDKTRVITYVTGDPYSANYIKIEELQAGKSIVKNYYLHRDNQGTIVGISDEAGVIVEQRSFDAWGNLQGIKIQGVDGKIDELGWNRQLLLDRGYTGHEHLYTVGLIHMNGRIYDPKLRRFLSPDNYVQDNTNTQNYNRYGYVLNNPLLYIDPSGEELGIWGSVIIGAAIAIVSTVVMNAINDVPIWYGLGKATVLGAASGASSYGIGVAVSAAKLDVIVQAAMHGASAGQMSLLSGDGNFWSSFASGAISSLVSSGIGALGPKGAGYLNSGTTQALMIVGGGVSGGISSSIAGGNFWQGMQQGLITSGLNHVVHSFQERRLENKKARELQNQYRYSAEDTAIIEEWLINHPIEVEGSIVKFKGIDDLYIDMNGKDKAQFIVVGIDVGEYLKSKAEGAVQGFVLENIFKMGKRTSSVFGALFQSQELGDSTSSKWKLMERTAQINNAKDVLFEYMFKPKSISQSPFKIVTDSRWSEYYRYGFRRQKIK